MSIGDPILPPPPWFDETPPPPPTSREDMLPPTTSFDETQSLKTAQAPETPTIPSVAKRRSGTLHLEESCIEALAIRHVAPRDSCSDHSASTATGGVQVSCVSCVHFEGSDAKNQTLRK